MDTTADTTVDVATDTVTESDGAPAECGNGIIEEGEECDDGGISAECNANCTVSTCGDGITNSVAGEVCDDGGASEDCDADCTLVQCGDGTPNAAAGEVCDDGGASEDCDADCTFPECGDGTVNALAGEVCDGEESASCDTDCTVPDCGDGLLNVSAGEVCDDGNLIDYDTCSNSCACGTYSPSGSSESYTNNCFVATDWTLYESYDGMSGNTSVTLSATLQGTLSDIDPGDRITMHVVLLDPLRIEGAVNYASVSFHTGTFSGGNTATASMTTALATVLGSVTLAPGNAGYYGTASAGTIGGGWYNLSVTSPTTGQVLEVMTVSFTSPATFTSGNPVNPDQSLAGGSVSISYNANGDIRGGPYPVSIGP